jgi:predicted metal-dependent peptidase
MMPDDYSWRMPRDYGYMGGGLVPTMDGGNPKVLIVVDGSGSMDVGLTDQAFEICKGSVGHGQEPLIAVGDTNLSYPTGSKPGRWAEVQRLLRSEDGLQNVGGGTEMGRVAWEAYDRLVERPEVVVIMTDGGTYWPSKERPVMVNGRPRTRLPDNTIVCVIGRSEGQMISAMPREIRRHAIFVKRDEELGRSL